MDRFERIYQLHTILSGRRTPASNRLLQDKLECSESTIKRLVGLMRNHFDAPIIYDRKRNGYYYDMETGAHPYELPGLWFNADELWGLLTCHRMLRDISHGIFGEQIAQLQTRIEKLLALDNSSAECKLESVKILTMASRYKGHDQLFTKIAAALFGNRRLKLVYQARSDGQISERTISPQNLIYYRDNWYIDAWCHSKNGLRTFALEKIKTAIRQNIPAKHIDRQQLEAHYASAYGIFGGPAQHLAKLKFTPERARWIADEKWHPKQTGRWLDNGSYELCIPFGDHRELLMDILRHGRNVEIIEPEFLKQAAIQEIQAMSEIYK
jgi:proteasome accessory factor C